MFEFVTTRLLQGFLSGIGLATLFYFYPIMKHLLNDKYRRKFQIAEFGKELFKIETIKYLRKGLLSIFVGALMLLSSLLLIPFPSYGVFEIVYVFLIIFWNASLFYKRIIKEDSPVNLE